MALIREHTVSATFLARVQASPKRAAFRHKAAAPPHRWQSVTFEDFYVACKEVSFGLMALDVRPTDKVAILSRTRYEWSLCDMAILGAGAVTVPIYSSTTTDDISHILDDSGAVVAIVENETLLKRLPATAGKLRHIILLEGTAPKSDALQDAVEVIGLTELRERGRRLEARTPSRFADQLAGARPDDLLTICYTSGTTGNPKGAMLTHANMMSVLDDCATLLAKHITPERELVLSFLPFAHILGKVESVAIYVFGWEQAFAESLEALMGNMREVRPTLIFAVPRTFEKAWSVIQDKLDRGPALYRRAFQWAFGISGEYFDAIHARKFPSVTVLAQYLVIRKTLFARIAQDFGGRLRFAVCGGAPLPKEIGEAFEVIGLRIREGYGLTETCGPITLNTPEQTRFGTVGRPLPEVTLKIAEDGEILVKSKKVFRGYYRKPEETAEVLKDGWLHTGDIGQIDSQGFLTITDRKKDLIITSGGKNIAPQKIENLAKQNRFISHLVVAGDNRNYLTALVTLKQPEIIAYANENQILFSEYRELVRNPRILGLVQRAIDAINKQLASYETIKKFLILPHDFTVENGDLTPSLKVRRRAISERYRAEFESMYAKPVRKVRRA